MLGWSFSVTDEKKKCYAYWEGGIFADEWLVKLEKIGLARKLDMRGGYPNLYEVFSDNELVVEKLLENGVKEEDLPKAQWLMVMVWDQS